MASESVKILIQAEDQASAKIAQASANIDANVKKIKETGERAKKSTEFVGTIGTMLGGSDFGSFSSQLGGIIEKTSQFSEVMKAGGLGADMFALGLMGAAASLGFMAGKALGDAIFETDKYNKELEKAIQLSGELSAKLSKSFREQAGREAKGIDLIADPAEKEKEYAKLIARIETEVKGAATEVLDLEKKLKAAKFEEEGNVLAPVGITFAEGLNTLPGQIEEAKKRQQEYFDQLQQTRAAMAAIAEDQEKIGNAATESLSKEAAKLEAQLADGQKINEIGKSRSQIIQEEIKLLEDRNYNMESFAQQAADLGGTDEAKARNQELLIENEIKRKQLDLQKELAKERQKQSDDEFAALQKLEQLERSQLDSIRLKTIEATKGKEAREAEALVMQGMERTDAERLARSQAAADKQLENANRIREIEKDIALKTIEATKGRLAAQVEEMVQGGMERSQAQDLAKRQAEADARLQRSQNQQPLQAFVSRFLTRGPTEPQRLEEIGKQQAKSLAEAVGVLKSIDAQAKRPTATLKLAIDGG